MISEILGQSGSGLFKELTFVADKLNAEQASFVECTLSPEEMAKLPPSALLQSIYLQAVWSSYVASASAILRAHIWSRGLVDAYGASNYFSFCANFRGLIESTADTFYSFKDMPDLLISHFPGFKSAVHNEIPVLPTNYSELCDKLGHFIHAQKQPKGITTGEKNRPSKEYMDTYEQQCPGVVGLYDDLCQVVHPSAQSVYWMIQPDDGEEKRSFFIGTSTSATQIIEFIETHNDRIFLSILDGLAKPLVCLKILGLLGHPDLKLDFMDGVNLNPITGWPDMQNRIKSCL